MSKIEALFLRCSHFLADEDEIKRVNDKYPFINVTAVDEKDYTDEQISKAEIIVGFPKPKDLIKAVNLKWLQTPSSGIEDYAKKELYVNKDILITRATGTYGRQIADHTMGKILGFQHFLFTYRDQMKQSLWKRYYPSKDLWESTLLIVGLGDIGTQVAKRAKASEMHIIGIKRTLGEKPDFVDELYTLESLDEVLPKADYVVIAISLTDKTKHLFDAKRLSLMKKGSVLINIARGTIIDQDALIESLNSGHLGAAALDVTTPEPLPSDSKLWKFDNVLITPHSSGLSYSDPHQVFDLFFANIEHYLNDQKQMRNLVDFSRQY